MAAFLSCSVTAGAVVIDSTKAENDTVLYINRDTLDDLENKIEGCVVTYSKSGDASIYAAFYENETLKGVALNSVNLEKGNNDFTINIDNPEKYSDCNLRFYVWDSNMTPVLTKETQFYRTETFSDEYEPYYPMLTAQIKTVDEIYQSTLPTSFELTQNQKDVRWQVVKMYKDAGFDITDGISPEGVDDEKKAIFNIPSGWSTLTPKSLVGNYEQMYSIDACFNRKIPEAAPMVELNDEVINFENLHIAVNNTPAARGGQGTGIARVIGRENDPLKTVMARWNAAVYAPQALYRLHVPENAGDFLNINPSSDRHAIFIDDTERVAVHIYEAVPPTGVFPYDLDTGRIPGFFIRGAASGNLIELTGIGAEGISGGYATGVVADGYTVKSNEIKNPDTMINHAVSAAINPVMFGRIYPALTSDAGGVNDASNFGAVPEGGVIRLDPEYNLEALYNSQKLSLPSYKILKAVQEYGLYNVDRGGYGKGKGVMLYTSTNKSDWYNEDDISFNVPYANNEQGYEAVTKEIVAFMAGDEYFGEEKPKLYVTIPVVKYAKLDIDKNGIIEEADMNIVSEAKVYNKEYDVNCDGIIDYKDKRVYENYFADLPQHKNAEDLCTLTVTSIDTRGGKVMVRGAAYDESGNGRKFKIKKGQLVTISAVEYTGWEFDRWSGDFEGIDDNIITIRADRDYNISPQYTRKTSYKLNVNIDGGGKVRVSTDASTYYSPGYYAEDTLLYIKAIPDDGNVVDSWSGDVTGHGEIQKLVMKQGATVNISFAAGYSEDYSEDNWTCITDGLPDDAYAINAEKGQIEFNFSSFSYTPVLINTKQPLNGNWVLNVQLNNVVNLGNGNGSRVIFGYKDKNNYNYMYVGGSGGNVALYNIRGGVTSCIKKYTGLLESGFTSFTAYPISLRFECTDDKLTVSGYKNNDELKYFENIEGNFDGNFGVAGQYHGYLYFNHISAIIKDEE